MAIRKSKGRRIDVDKLTSIDPSKRWHTPKDQFIRSNEWNGKVPSIKEIAHLWGRDYNSIRDQARVEKWLKLRETYQAELQAEVERVSIQRIASEQAEIEASYLANTQKIRRAIQLRLDEIDEKGEMAEGSLKELLTMLDKANKLERRNAGMPETSRELRVTKQITQLIVDVQGIFVKHVTDPGVLRSAEQDFMSLRAKYIEGKTAK